MAKAACASPCPATIEWRIRQCAITAMTEAELNAPSHALSQVMLLCPSRCSCSDSLLSSNSGVHIYTGCAEHDLPQPHVLLLESCLWEWHRGLGLILGSWRWRGLAHCLGLACSCTAGGRIHGHDIPAAQCEMMSLIAETFSAERFGHLPNDVITH